MSVLRWQTCGQEETPDGCSVVGFVQLRAGVRLFSAARAQVGFALLQWPELWKGTPA